MYKPKLWYDEYVEKLVKAFENVKVGDPLDPETQMGALRDKQRFEVLEEFIEKAKAGGGKVLTGGQPLTENGLDKGAFLHQQFLQMYQQIMRL